MKRSEETFLREFEASLGAETKFDAPREEGEVIKFKKRNIYAKKAAFCTLAAVLVLAVISAVTVPTALALSRSVGGGGDALTVGDLREMRCLFFEDLAFYDDGQKNHIYVIKNEEIVTHYGYDRVTAEAENFDDIRDKTVVEAVAVIGIPSFVGLSDELSLDYSMDDGYIRRLKLSGEGEDLVIDDVEQFDKNDPVSWLDRDKKILPAREECEQIVSGMKIEEVMQRIGKPQRDIGSGAISFQFDVADGSILGVMFTAEMTEENGAYVRNFYVWKAELDVDFVPDISEGFGRAL